MAFIDVIFGIDICVFYSCSVKNRCYCAFPHFARRQRVRLKRRLILSTVCESGPPTPLSGAVLLAVRRLPGLADLVLWGASGLECAVKCELRSGT